MKRSRSGCSGVLWIAIAAGLIITAGLALNVVSAIPAKAEALYGAPSERVSASQRFILSYKLVNDQDILFTPQNPAGGYFEFVITPDESVNSILARLEEIDLIRETEAVRNYLVYAGLDTRIQTGSFALSPAMSPIEIINALLDPTPRDGILVILAGWRLEEIAASLPTTGLEITPEEFIAATNTRGYTARMMQFVPAGRSLEGLFPPGSYQVERSLTAEQLVELLLDEFDELLPFEIQSGIESQGLSLYEGLILASIVEREAVVEEEMPIIASVFYNRLAIGMKLETDPTVQYALGFNNSQNTWWTNPLSLADLEIDSPFNTYLYPGLPPTPIANPSLTALQAVAFPAKTPYYYFRAACDGSGLHNFSQTFEEHLQNACP
jgi:UPF0755 protein